MNRYKRFHVAKVQISNRGSHFKNSFKLKSRTSYSTQRNATVERINIKKVRVSKVYSSEYKLTSEKCDALLPVG